ncbi:LysR family transcriptional regulator ArgP [Kineococcus sp. SYSU DK004]|uniref:LysR family transcriptional regulator ArgP n=1 Tax=Kineococcus sp. SYSU DK004 TaxID=3383125 RepID=UPI003D7DCDA1
MDPAPDVDLGQLRALRAAVDEGSLEAAARVLHVTPSAVSQRLRALEVATGRVLLVRSRPVRVTESGQVLLRLARQVELLSTDALAELGGAHGAPRPGPSVPTLPIAVNADSLATWVLPALAPLAGSVALDLHRDDEGRTADLLRDGTVVAAVTTEPDPVAGCSVTALGAVRYRPVASAAFARRWLPGALTAPPGPAALAGALATAPVVVFDRADDLQHRWLRRVAGPDAAPPVHHVPASADFLAAVHLGMGWGMLPDLQVGAGGPDERSGLVVLDPAGAVDVALHWQQWKLRSPALDAVTRAVTDAARHHLVPPGPA